MSIKKKAIHGFMWTFLEQFGRTGIKFIVQLALARLIAPDQFGYLGMIGIFYAIAETLSQAGLNQSLLRMNKPTNIDYNTVFWQNVLLSSFIYTVIFISAPFISLFYKEPILSPVIRVYSLSIIISCFSSIQLTKYTKDLNFKVQTTVLIPSIIISSILGIILAFYGYGIWALVYMQVAQSIISAVQLWIRSEWKPKFEFNWETSKYHLNFGYKLMFSGLINNIFINIYPMIIGKYNSPTQVGFYSRALSFRSLPVTMIAGMFGKVTFPVLAEYKNQPEHFLVVFRKFIKVLLLLSTFVLLAFIVVAKPLILILIGEQWLPSIKMFQWIAMGGLFIILQSYLSNVLAVFGKSDLILKSLIYSRIINLVIIIFTAPLGIMAIIYGQLLAEIINVIFIQIYCGILLKFSLIKQYLDILPILLPGLIIMGLVLLIFDKIEMIVNNNIIEFTINFVIFSVLYIISQYILNRKILHEVYKMKNLFK